MKAMNRDGVQRGVAQEDYLSSLIQSQDPHTFGKSMLKTPRFHMMLLIWCREADEDEMV
mgnify:CR=1 FL=1